MQRSSHHAQEGFDIRTPDLASFQLKHFSLFKAPCYKTNFWLESFIRGVRFTAKITLHNALIHDQLLIKKFRFIHSTPINDQLLNRKEFKWIAKREPFDESSYRRSKLFFGPILFILRMPSWISSQIGIALPWSDIMLLQWYSKLIFWCNFIYMKNEIGMLLPREL